jgi:hypothetical protein
MGSYGHVLGEEGRKTRRRWVVMGTYWGEGGEKNKQKNEHEETYRKKDTLKTST